MRKIILLIMVILFQETAFIHSVNAAQESKQEKFTIRNIRFNGNRAFKSKSLNKFLVLFHGKIKGTEYDEETLKDFINTIKLVYNQNGYLDAEISASTATKDQKKKTLIIDIGIKEGKLTRIGVISFFGNNSISDKVLTKSAGIKTKDPFRRSMVEQATLNILAKYADNGFLEADVRPDIKILSDTGQAVIDFMITENDKFSIGEINIKGLDKTKPDVVRREFIFHKGETVNYSKLLESQRKIYLTGLFSSVYIKPVSSPDSLKGIKDILVEITEKDNGEFNISLGYDTIERLRGKTELYNNNLNGTSNKLGLKATASFIARTTEGSLTFPWTFSRPIRTDLNLKNHFNSEPGYDVYGNVASLTVGRQFRKFTNLSLTYRQQQNSYRHITLAEPPENLKNKTSSLKLALIRDTRDNLFNASRGTYFDVSNELGSFYSGGTNSFIRLIGIFKYFHPINSETVVGTSLEIGIIDARKGLAEIPLTERFYGGGPNSMRGFAYSKLGPLDDKNKPLGGKFEIIGNIFEIRRTVYKIVGVAAFVDAGNIWGNITDFRVNQIRLNAGAGLRISTPVGPIRIDYSSKLDRKAGESANELYFSMGQAF